MSYLTFTEMNYKHTFEAAINNLIEIKYLLEGFQGEGSVSSIEIDLALQKTRNLYEILLLFKQDGPIKPQADHRRRVPEPDTKPVTDPKPVKEESYEAGDESFELAREMPLENESSSPPLQDIKEERTVLSQSHKGKKLLGESLHQNVPYQDLSSRLHAKPITDLAKAIEINERFLYIRELFGNDAKKYEKTIQVLNNAANFNEAYNYMIREYTWDMDSELVQGLLEVVRRKFITGQHE